MEKIAPKILDKSPNNISELTNMNMSVGGLIVSSYFFVVLIRVAQKIEELGNKGSLSILSIFTVIITTSFHPIILLLDSINPHILLSMKKFLNIWECGRVPDGKNFYYKEIINNTLPEVDSENEDNINEIMNNASEQTNVPCLTEQSYNQTLNKAMSSSCLPKSFNRSMNYKTNSMSMSAQQTRYYQDDPLLNMSCQPYTSDNSVSKTSEVGKNDKTSMKAFSQGQNQIQSNQSNHTSQNSLYSYSAGSNYNPSYSMDSSYANSPLSSKDYSTQSNISNLDSQSHSRHNSSGYINDYQNYSYDIQSRFQYYEKTISTLREALHNHLSTIESQYIEINNLSTELDNKNLQNNYFANELKQLREENSYYRQYITELEDKLHLNHSLDSMFPSNTAVPPGFQPHSSGSLSYKSDLTHQNIPYPMDGNTSSARSSNTSPVDMIVPVNKSSTPVSSNETIPITVTLSKSHSISSVPSIHSFVPRPSLPSLSIPSTSISTMTTTDPFSNPMTTNASPAVHSSQLFQRYPGKERVRPVSLPTSNSMPLNNEFNSFIHTSSDTPASLNQHASFDNPNINLPSDTHTYDASLKMNPKDSSSDTQISTQLPVSSTINNSNISPTSVNSFTNTTTTDTNNSGSTIESLLPGLTLKRRIKVSDKEYFNIKKSLADTISREQTQLGMEVNTQVKPLILMKIIQYVLFIDIENENHMNTVASVFSSEIPVFQKVNIDTIFELIKRIKDILMNTKK